MDRFLTTVYCNHMIRVDIECDMNGASFYGSLRLVGK